MTNIGFAEVIGILGAGIIFLPREIDIKIKKKRIFFLVLSQVYSLISLMLIYWTRPPLSFPTAGDVILVWFFWFSAYFISFSYKDKRPEAKVFNMKHERIFYKRKNYQIILIVAGFIYGVLFYLIKMILFLVKNFLS